MKTIMVSNPFISIYDVWILTHLSMPMLSMSMQKTGLQKGQTVGAQNCWPRRVLSVQHGNSCGWWKSSIYWILNPSNIMKIVQTPTINNQPFIAINYSTMFLLLDFCWTYLNASFPFNHQPTGVEHSHCSDRRTIRCYDSFRSPSSILRASWIEYGTNASSGKRCGSCVSCLCGWLIKEHVAFVVLVIYFHHNHTISYNLQ